MVECKNEDDLRKYVNQNDEAGQFLKKNRELSPKSFGKFAVKYNDLGKQRGGAKFSERIFTSWTTAVLREANFPGPVSIHHTYSIGNIECDDRSPLEKRIDFYFQSGKRKVCIEFKCNIDNIEKDLYKFWLIKRNGQNPDVVTVLLIWEAEDHWEYKKGGLSQYAKLLQDAEGNKILNAYFYLPQGNDAKIEENIDMYKTFLKPMAACGRKGS